MSQQQYNSADIEVLKGLEPVQMRPGMYTQTECPNHLAQEVIDNSVDEAMAGHATQIDIVLHEDHSLSVADNGRGMPIDIHQDEKISGVELIMTRLHAGGKFSNKNYQYAGGLHGVGISVVNALSERVEVQVKRGGQEYAISFAHGLKTSDLQAIGKVGVRNTGTKVHFWPAAKYFDSIKFSTTRLKHNLRAKAVLCSGLQIRFENKLNGEKESWCYENGLSEYLSSEISSFEILPEHPFVDKFKDEQNEIEWAIAWLQPQQTNAKNITESYANLIPTPMGGTHVNGLRTGLTEAIREFCEIRNLLPRGVKINPEDVWDGCNYVLSIKLKDPQFSGQTKERLSSRTSAGLVSQVVKDAFGLWLNHHVAIAETIATLMIEKAQSRLRASKKVVRKKVVQGPALPGKLSDCVSGFAEEAELFLVEGDSAGGSAKQARDRNFQAIMPLRGKILNTWEVEHGMVLSSQEVHDISVAIGVDPGNEDIEGLRYSKICILADADSDGLHIATLLCALFVKHFLPVVKAGHIYVAMPPLFRIDVGKEVFYALDEAEKEAVLNKIHQEKIKGKISIQRFKGLGEMNPAQLRETTIAPDTRRLVRLTIDDELATSQIMDMLLAKKRSSDRRNWLESKGNHAESF